MHEGQKQTTAFWVSKTRHAPTLSNSSEQCINPIRKWARLRYLCVFVKPQPLKTKSECWPYFWRSLAGVDWSGVQQYQSVISPPSSVVSELDKSLKESVCSTLVDLITQMAGFVFFIHFFAGEAALHRQKISVAWPRQRWREHGSTYISRKSLAHFPCYKGAYFGLIRSNCFN